MRKIETAAATFAILFVLNLLGAQLSWAATYWAAPQGSSSATCSAISGASDPGRYGSFARTVACATATGDIVMVKPGTYTSDATIINPSSGITIRGSDPTNANWPVLQPTGSSVRAIHFNNTTKSNITVKFLKVDFSNVTSASTCFSASSDAFVTNFTVEDFECLGPPVGQAIDTGTAVGPGPNTYGWIFRRGKIRRWYSADGSPGAHCFYWKGDNGLIEQVDCSDVNGYGIQYYGTASTDNNTVRYSTFHDFALRGPIYVQSNSTGNQFYGNLFYNYKGTTAIQLRGTNTMVWNNTIYNTTGGSVGINVQCSSGCEVKNNIIYIPGGTPIYGTTATNISNNLTTDPMFVDSTKFNFRVKSASPAIDKGVTISKVTTDLAGILRPQGGYYDIGAYEYVAATTNPPVAPGNLVASPQ